MNMSKSRDGHWALYAKSVLDRTRLALASKAEEYHQVLQPSAEYLGSRLGVDQRAVSQLVQSFSIKNKSSIKYRKRNL